MTTVSHKLEWTAYRDKTLQEIKPILEGLGFVIDKKQVHIKGERYVSSGKKLVLFGHIKNSSKKVVIKISSSPDKISEIRSERQRREILNKIIFAYRTFWSPKEILYTTKNNYLIAITEFIEQKKTYLERTLKEQFFYALRAFNAQEGVHVTTLGHAETIKNYFGAMSAQDYISNFKNFNKETFAVLKNDHLNKLLQKTHNYLVKNKNIINLYSNFLTHWDFVPHNIRIKNDNIYLLDHSSFRLGNKHESWARFINFMTLYNRPLEHALVNYVKDNRTPEESASLKLMRLYRLGELITFYTKTLNKADGNLRQLNTERVRFWTSVLEHVFNNQGIPDDVIKEYQTIRDSLRSKSELERQKGLH